MPLYYFAYGSNMLAARLTARRLGIATLPAWQLRFHKVGSDGSGKGDIVPAADGGVTGADIRSNRQCSDARAADIQGQDRAALQGVARGVQHGQQGLAQGRGSKILPPELNRPGSPRPVWARNPRSALGAHSGERDRSFRGSNR